MKISTRPFGTTRSGEEVHCIRLEHDSGIVAEVLSYGAILRALWVPTAAGSVQVCAGYETLEEYEAGTCYLGAVVGRCAGRIDGGHFVLNGTEYQLPQNQNGNHLHGGVEGFDRKVWGIQILPRYRGVRFFRRSEDGEEGYPGAVEVSATYLFEEDGALTLRFDALAEGDTILSMTRNAIADHVAMAFGEAQALDAAGCREMLRGLEGLYFPKDTFQFTEDDAADKTQQDFTDLFLEAAEKTYEAKEAEIGTPLMRELERVIMLRVVDEYWMDHIDAMDQLRQGIGLQAYGQRDPLVEYKMLGYDMFGAMTNAIAEDTVRLLFHVRIEQKVEREQVAQVTGTNKDDTSVKEPKKREEKKVYPNDPCPCGSGKKYKQCCGRK